MPCSCRSQVDPLLDQVAGSVASFTGDGAYDHDRVYAGVAERHPEAAVVVPPRSIAVPSEMAETAPTQRDGHLQHIAKHGRMAWQNASGYNKRARVEATMGRWKQVIGDGLRAHTDKRRATEVAVAVHALDRMREFGRPIYVRGRRTYTASCRNSTPRPSPIFWPVPKTASGYASLSSTRICDYFGRVAAQFACPLAMTPG